jgi:hypothetical protein
VRTIFFLPLAPPPPPTRELAPILEHKADYSVSWPFTGGRTPLTGDQLVAKPIPTHSEHSCPGQDSNPKSRLPSYRRQLGYSDRRENNRRLNNTLRGQNEDIFSIILVGHVVAVVLRRAYMVLRRSH